MPLTCDDHYKLSQMLDAIAVPMFAAERHTPNEPFRMICVNNAHSKKTGIRTPQIRNLRTSDFLAPKDAVFVEQNYQKCADSRCVTNYEENLKLNGLSTTWNTTLQPVTVTNGCQRIVGTAIAVERAPIHEILDDAAFYSACAQMQVGKLRTFLEILGERRDVPVDMRSTAMMVSNITRSIDAVLDDIRAISAPGKYQKQMPVFQYPAILN